MAQLDSQARPTTAGARSLLARPVFWWVLAAVVLLLGYADLARGGVTLAPILLIIGYCVLIPVAILR